MREEPCTDPYARFCGQTEAAASTDPMPEEDDRRRLWVANLPATLPQAAEIDLDFLARRFRVSGGNIRNVAAAAAFLAADAGRAMTMEDLVRETAREYRKLGRLCVEAEFGPWFAIVG